ncbi:TRAP transporter large permease [Brevibacterium jeotgali]|uniref:Tripartite ATP-independent transporter, DctM component n=1 Tax=Brevibacterium jeotgali TaxID=1262550 RepID=A0A2H1L8E2_9MICO|nr:TRAP transporter large permease [Brevibacterium jeotgali]TWC02295.1 tripartite ATP-independent transporter DctM subunit [Brevibacterium jeotgali]SMY12653.1 Tripartite ATP-independent transporter, DctM component [Brevibacterium jeotgali]
MEIFIGLVILFALLIVGVPVFWTFLGVTLFLVVSLGYDPNFLLPYGYSQLNSSLLLAIPLFIIAGKLIERGGIGDVIVEWTELLIGRVKGGLGVTTVVACAVFGSISGSALAALSTIGSIMFGKLHRANYPRGFATALVANASVLGLLIPPSGIMILYAWIANVSVLAAFLSTLIPGIILTVILSVITMIYMRNRSTAAGSGTDGPVPGGGAAPRGFAGAPSFVPARQESVLMTAVEPPTVASRAKAFAKVTFRGIPALLLPVIILGGIYSGLFTTVEAAAVAAVYTIPVGLWIYRRLRIGELRPVLIEAATTTGVVMVMAYSMMILSRVFTMEKLPEKINGVLLSVSSNPAVILIMINLSILILGMLIDDVSGTLLITPILLPVAMSIGVDPIHFAAILGVNLGLANITPPTAPLLYFGSQLGNAPINEMLKPALMMIVCAWIPTLILTTYIPDLSLWLPRVILGY